MESNKEVLKFTSYQKMVVALLALTQFSVVLDFMIMNPLGDALMKAMDLSTMQFGIVVSSYAISAGVSGFLTAGFADRFDRKKMLVFFYIGFIIGTLLCGLVTNYELMVAARIFTGIFGGVIGSISMAIVSDLFVAAQRGRAMGIMQMGFGASQVLGIPISLYLSYLWSWQVPFFLVVLIASVVCILLVINLKPVVDHLKGENEQNAFKHLFKTLKNRNYRIGFLATALMSMGGFMIMPWGSSFVVNNLKMTEIQLMLLFIIGGVITLLIMPFIGKISDKIDRFKLFTIASIWMMIVVIIYTNMHDVSFWFLATMYSLMMMGVMSRMVPSMALVTSLPELHDRGAFMSINSSLQQMAGGIAAAIGGLIVVQKTKTSPLENYDNLGYVIALIVMICIFMVYRVSVLIKKKNSN